jgi:bilirubin oxidase
MKKIHPFVLMLVMAMASSPGFAQFSNPLFVPDTLAGPVYNLNVAPATVNFIAGTATETYGINGPYLGPTLIMRKGDQVTMNVSNNLGETTTMHWHGMHVAPEDDGGPHTAIPDGTTWSPEFTVMDEATTFWYHPHLHEYTADQVYRGAAGMIIVRDDHSDSLNLPHTYGVDDFPIIIQDKSFDSTNRLIFTAMADTIVINGTLGAYLEVPAQMVRFRLLNGSNQRVYNMGFPPNVPVFQIGSDGGLLKNPVAVNRVQLAPGERAEVVVDFSLELNKTFPLPTFNSEMTRGVSGGPGGPGGGPGNPLDSADFNLMEFRVRPPTSNAVTSLPNVLNSYDKPLAANAVRTRVKVMDADTSGFPFYINSTPFNHMVVNDTVILDDIEIWELSNITDVAHPFHIHDIQFFILDYNGMPPPPTLAGRKDVVLLNPGDTISFITHFTDFADSTIPYMYHCHNLFHEDAGMMGQFVVWEQSWVSRESEIALEQGFRMFPNPASDLIHLEVTDQRNGLMAEVRLLDLQGRELRRVIPMRKDRVSLDVAGLSAGIYLLEVRTMDGGRAVLRMVKGD